MSSAKRESVTVLEECIELQKRKSQDYQNPNSNIVQSMHYRRGVSTIHDMISQKLLRAQSLLEAYENGENTTPNFESLEDTYKDLINYASFAVSYLRGQMEGQDQNRDMLNRVKPKTTYVIKPPGGGTGTGVEVTMEDFNQHVASDISGGSSSGQVEGDGFVTVWPTLLGEPNANTELHIPLKGETSGESKIKQAYFRDVLPKGEIRVPQGETMCTDNIVATYHRELKPKRNRPKPRGK
jgi:hypothetical protein